MNSEWEELRKYWLEECNIQYVSIWAKAPDIRMRSELEKRASALYDGKRLGTYKGRDI